MLIHSLICSYQSLYRQADRHFYLLNLYLPNDLKNTPALYSNLICACSSEDSCIC